MCLIPLFYCDRCGHAFNNPDRYSRKGLRVVNKWEEEMSDDARCPKCLNPNFEILVVENEQDSKSNHSARYARDKAS
jgi:rubredoxin